MRRISYAIAVTLILGVCSFIYVGVVTNSHAEAIQKKPLYQDKNNHFCFQPPEGWEKLEFDDPRTKVEFFVPMGTGNNRKASLFLLTHPVTTLSPDGKGKVDLRTESRDRVSKLKKAGASDAQFKIMQFCEVEASQIDATLPQSQARMHAIWFIKYGRSYTISFTTQSVFYPQYLPIVEEAFSTFQCISPTGKKDVSQADRDRIQQERIRAFIGALKGPDTYIAEISLLEIGEAAVPALIEIQKTGTKNQKEKAAKILEQIRQSHRPYR